MRKSVSRKTLLASAAALSLSALLFAGTTYAWFTDSASSAASTIQSGNLDIGLEVYSKSAGKYVTVDSSTDLFAAASNDSTGPWEPGHAEVVYLKVSNLGSLTLKYQLTVSKVSETAGKNANGDDIYLSKYLKYGLVNNVQAGDLNSRSAAVAAADTNAKALDQYSDINTLDPKGADTADQYVALVVYMPETVDNDANYAAGSNIPTIKLGVTAAAVQAVSENDSFGNTYDEKAFDELAKPVWISVGDSYGTVSQVQTGTNLYKDTEGDQLYTLYNGEAVALKASSKAEGLYTDDEGTNYVSSTEALTAASSTKQSEIVLIGDISQTFTESQSEIKSLRADTHANVALDLDGSTITIESTSGKNGITSNTDSVLSLSNGTVIADKMGSGLNSLISTSYGTVNLMNMNVILNGSGTAVSSNQNTGMVNIINSAVSKTESGGSPVISVRTQGSAVIENSTITGKITVEDSSSLKILSGDFSNAAFDFKNGSIVTATGGKFSQDPSAIKNLTIPEGYIVKTDDEGYFVISAE